MRPVFSSDPTIQGPLVKDANPPSPPFLAPPTRGRQTRTAGLLFRPGLRKDTESNPRLPAIRPPRRPEKPPGGAYSLSYCPEESKQMLLTQKIFRCLPFDPLYGTGKRYYLAPDGPAGQKAYALLYQAMVEENRYALARVVLHGREQLVLLRPQENLLILEVLHYHHQVTQPAALAQEAPKTEVAPEELKMAKTLVNASTGDFTLDKYPDLYTSKLQQLIEAKIAGKEIVAAPAAEGPQVINLMEALKQSVARVMAI